MQSLQGAFDSSRCVHMESALCRIRERCCGINVAASSFPFCAGTWEEEEGSVFVFFWGGGRRTSGCGMVGKFMMNFRFLFTSNFL